MNVPAALPGLLSGDLIAQRWYALLGRGWTPPDPARANDAEYAVRTDGTPLWIYLLACIVVADLFAMAGLWLRSANGSSPNGSFGWWAFAGVALVVICIKLRSWLDPLFPDRPWLWVDSGGLSVRNRFHVPWSALRQIQPVIENGKSGEFITALSLSFEMEGRLKHVTLRSFNVLNNPGEIYEILRGIAARYGAVLQPLPARVLVYERRHATDGYARKI